VCSPNGPPATSSGRTLSVTITERSGIERTAPNGKLKCSFDLDDHRAATYFTRDTHLNWLAKERRRHVLVHTRGNPTLPHSKATARTVSEIL